MATDWTVKLTFGKREIDLTSGRYKVRGFVPPSVATLPLIATGTSANRHGGGWKVAERAVDRPYTLAFIVIGASDAELAKGAADVGSFLALAGSSTITPLYLEVRPNSDAAFEPIYGQYGANKKYEIIHAMMPTPWERYAEADLRAKGSWYTAELLLGPYADGNQQIVGTAVGGVLEDNFVWQDGFSRGTMIPEATTNLHVNPVFGNNATWNTAWTDSATLTDIENTDERFILFGWSSAKLTSSGGNGTYTQSLTLAAATHNLSYYVKLPDGGAVSATECQIHYNGTGQSTTYTAVGDDGWYRISAEVTGTGGAAATGIIVNDGYTIYMDMSQAEQKSYVTPPCYGDLLGCAWSATAHGGTVGTDQSTRTAAAILIPVSDVMNIAEGTIRVVWKADRANSDMPSISWIFDTTGNIQQGWWDQASTIWRFTDNTTTISSGATTFSANDKIILHYTFGPDDGINQYLNGTLDGNNATYTPPAAPTNIYIGCSASTTQHINGTFVEFAIYDRVMSAQEVSNDYDNVSQLTADNDIVGSIPWLWTKDGDDVVDNCDDSGRNNWAVIGGVPGSAPAATVIDGQLSSAWSTVEQVVISNNHHDRFANPSTGQFVDLSGTADIGASSGDAYQDFTATTGDSSTSIQIFDEEEQEFARALVGKNVYMVIRAKDAGSQFKVRFIWYMGVNNLAADYRTFTSSASFRLYICEAIRLPLERDLLMSELSFYDSTTNYVFGYSRPSGSATLSVDYVALMPTPVVVITRASAADGTAGFVLKERNAMSYSTSTLGQSDVLQVDGDIMELWPHKLNHLTSFIGSTSVNPLVTYTMTYNAVRVTPRYALL